MSLLLCFVLLLSFAPVATAGSPGETDTATQRDEKMSGYRIGPGDLIGVRVFGVNDFDQVVRVSNSGKIHIRKLGVLRVAGFTLEGLSDEIAKRLRESGLVLEPWVQVRIDEYRARPVYILGEVMLPGQFVLKREMYLVDLITMAAGTNEVASDVAYLYRRAPLDFDKPSEEPNEARLGRDEVIAINLRQVLAGEDTEGNVLLQGGDVLYVPERRVQQFFVVGDVVKAGAYEIPLEEEITVTRAISMAGGPTRTAKSSESLLVRQVADNQQDRIPVNFRDIMAGKSADFAVKPDDIIFVPGSSSKILGYGLLGMLPGMAGDAAVR